MNSIWTCGQVNQAGVGNRRYRPGLTLRRMRSQHCGRVARRERAFERIIERSFTPLNFFGVWFARNARSILQIATHACPPPGRRGDETGGRL